jgi:hypothetical protein
MLASSRVRQVPPKTFSLYDVGRMKQMWSIPGELEAITNYYRALIRYAAGAYIQSVIIFLTLNIRAQRTSLFRA